MYFQLRGAKMAPASASLMPANQQTPAVSQSLGRVVSNILCDMTDVFYPDGRGTVWRRHMPDGR